MAKKNKNLIEDTQTKEILTQPDMVISPYMKSYMEALTFQQTQIGEDVEGSENLNIEEGPDYLVSPYMTNYMKARNPREFEDSYQKDNIVAKDVGYRRRKGFLILVVIFMVAILAIIGLGYLEIFPEYLSAYERLGEEYIDITDPIFGGLNKIAGIDIDNQDSIYYNDILKDIDEDTNIGLVIGYYALPVAAALFTLFALIILLIAIAALCKKESSKGYVEKKTKFGFMSILLFVFSLILVIGGLLWVSSSPSFEEIGEFFISDSTLVFAGYGLFAFIGLSLLPLIANLFAFKKQK